jgi:hypothetical protein
MNKTIIANCDGGIGNRYNTIVGCLALSALFRIPLKVFWPVNEWCGADYPDLFDLPLDYSDNEIPELSSGKVNQAHEALSQNKLGVPVYNYQKLNSLITFATDLDKSPNGVACAFTHLPVSIPRELLLTAGKALIFNRQIQTKARQFIQDQIKEPYYANHLRRTDINLGFTNQEVLEIA